MQGHHCGGLDGGRVTCGDGIEYLLYVIIDTNEEVMLTTSPSIISMIIITLFTDILVEGH